MSEGYPDNETDPQREGTACHALGALCIEKNKSPLTIQRTEIEGVTLTPEMREATKVYVDYVNERSKRYPYRVIERRLRDNRSTFDFGGTPDCVLFGTFDLEVVDAKFGRIPVEVLGNEQFLCYALLAWNEYLKRRPGVRVRLTVVQPNAFHKSGPRRSRTVTTKDLLDFEKRLHATVKVAEQKETIRLKPGRHCKYCPAFVECPAGGKYVNEIFGFNLND